MTNETSCYDTTPVTMEFTADEHDLLNDIIQYALGVYDFIPFHELYELSEDSEIRKRYFMLDSLKERSYQLWSRRFDTAPL